MNQETRRPFYLNIEDATAEVGITRRQLGYWLEKGLLAPELGPGARRFTARDLRRLRWLKRLVAELGLPVELVKRAIAAAGTDEVEGRRFLDLEDEVFVETADEPALRSAAEASSEERLYALAYLLFRRLADEAPSAEAYGRRREEVFAVLREVELAARVRVDLQEGIMAAAMFARGGDPTGAIRGVVEPALPDDAELSPDRLGDLALDTARRLATTLSHVGPALHRTDNTPRPFRRYADLLLDGLRRARDSR